MRNIRKNTLKALIAIALFCPAVFADGDMGGGGLADSGNGSKTGKAVIIRTTEDGDMGGGGRFADPSYVDAVMSSIYTYLDSWM